MTQVNKPPRIRLTPQRPQEEIRLADRTVVRIQIDGGEYQLSRADRRYVISDPEGRVTVSQEGLGLLKIDMITDRHHDLRLSRSDIKDSPRHKTERIIVLDQDHPGQDILLRDGMGRRDLIRCQGEEYVIFRRQGKACARDDQRGDIFYIAPGQISRVGNVLVSHSKQEQHRVSVQVVPREVLVKKEQPRALTSIREGEVVRVVFQSLSLTHEYELLAREGGICQLREVGKGDPTEIGLLREGSLVQVGLLLFRFFPAHGGFVSVKLNFMRRCLGPDNPYETIYLRTAEHTKEGYLYSVSFQKQRFVLRYEDDACCIRRSSKDSEPLVKLAADQQTEIDGLNFTTARKPAFVTVAMADLPVMPTEHETKAVRECLLW